MADRSPSVSVIMNCFNGQEFLNEAIASVIDQTCDDWELIFWDNCSSDDSASIVKHYDDSRIKYYYADKHTSLSAARNCAIAKATGDWIAFLDCDDIWLPEKLEKQIQRIEADKEVAGEPLLGVVYGRSLVIQPSGKVHDFLPRFENRLLPEGNILQQLLIEGVFLAAPTVMVKSTALEEIGGVNEQFTCAFDYYFLAAICENYRALAVQDCITKYRVHSNNLTFSFGEELYREPLAILEKWGHHISPAQLTRRKKEYHTLLSVQLLSHRKLWCAAKELLQNGSLTYLTGRLFSRFRQGRLFAR